MTVSTPSNTSVTVKGIDLRQLVPQVTHQLPKKYRLKTVSTPSNTSVTVKGID